MSDNKISTFTYLFLIGTLVVSVVTDLPVFTYVIGVVMIGALLAIIYNLGSYTTPNKKLNVYEKESVVETEIIVVQPSWESLTYEEKLNYFNKKDIIWNELPFNEKMKFHKYKKFRTELDDYNRKRAEKEKVKQERIEEEQRLAAIKEQALKEEQARIKKYEAELKQKQEIEERKREMQKQRDELKKQKIKHRILNQLKNKQLESEVIRELIDAGLLSKEENEKPMRESIPTHVKITVWERDRHRCVICFSDKNLEFDHDIPVSKGGANSIENIRILCRDCNRKKSNKIM